MNLNLKIFAGWMIAVLLSASAVDAQDFFERHAEVTTSDKYLLEKKIRRLGLEADSSRSNLFVHFVPQVHGSPFRLDRDSDLDEIASRQIQIAQFLVQHLDKPVFVEWFSVKETSQDIFYREITADDLNQIRQEMKSKLEQRLRMFFPVGDIQAIFPDGLPKEAGQLNVDQKKALAYLGGAAGVLFLLGKLTEIYPTGNSVLQAEQNELMQAALESWFSMPREATEKLGILSFEERETDALTYILLFSKALGLAGDVILIYGEAHLFQNYSRPGLLVLLAKNVAELEAQKKESYLDGDSDWIDQDLKDLMREIESR